MLKTGFGCDKVNVFCPKMLCNCVFLIVYVRFAFSSDATDDNSAVDNSLCQSVTYNTKASTYGRKYDSDCINFCVSESVS